MINVYLISFVYVCIPRSLPLPFGSYFSWSPAKIEFLHNRRSTASYNNPLHWQFCDPKVPERKTCETTIEPLCQTDVGIGRWWPMCICTQIRSAMSLDNSAWAWLFNAMPKIARSKASFAVEWLLASPQFECGRTFRCPSWQHRETVWCLAV